MMNTNATAKGFFQQAKESLTQFLAGIDPDDLESVLDDLFTPQEITELGERIELLRQLSAGKTQREIAADMGISVTTVNRGARVLQYGTGVIRKYV